MSDDLMPEGAEPEAEETEAPVPVTDDLPVEVRKHMDRQSRRIDKLQRQLAKSELKQRYDDLVDLIPDEMPTDKWEPWLEKVKARTAPPAETTEQQPEVQVFGDAVEAPSAEEKALAAVASGPTSVSPASPGMTDEEAIQWAMNATPEEYERRKRQGFSLPTLPGNQR